MFSSWDEKYMHDSAWLSKFPDRSAGSIAWECPSNIAVIKYWGKKAHQQPLNPSVSFALRQAKTNLKVEYSADCARKGLSLEYFFEDQPGKLFEDRFYKYLVQITPYMPFLNQSSLVIRAGNTFPHSAGIASSASSFGALALSLCSIEQKLFGTLSAEHEFVRKASFLARLGSGSACRSVYGGFSLWGRTPAFEPSSDEMAMPMNYLIHPVFRDYCDTILLIHTGEKEVSSSAGHLLMEQHPFYAGRILQANGNLEKMLVVLKNGDEYGFATLVEEEALTLHAMMMTSRPGYILLKPASLEVIGRIRQFRISTGLPVCFTLDAGANIHVLYPSGIREQVRGFIEAELLAFCDRGRIMHDNLGNGPVKIN
jgi:diphosphomevalonate decarboxylase